MLKTFVLRIPTLCKIGLSRLYNEIRYGKHNGTLGKHIITMRKHIASHCNWFRNLQFGSLDKVYIQRTLFRGLFIPFYLNIRRGPHHNSSKENLPNRKSIEKYYLPPYPANPFHHYYYYIVPTSLYATHQWKSTSKRTQSINHKPSSTGRVVKIAAKDLSFITQPPKSNHLHTIGIGIHPKATSMSFQKAYYAPLSILIVWFESRRAIPGKDELELIN